MGDAAWKSLNGGISLSRSEEVESEEIIIKECERGGVLDPSAWQNTEKWHADNSGNVLPAAGDLTGGNTGPTSAEIIPRRGDSQSGDFVAHNLSMPGNDADERALRLKRLTEKAQTSLAEAVRSLVDLVGIDLKSKNIGKALYHNGNQNQAGSTIRRSFSAVSAETASDCCNNKEGATPRQEGSSNESSAKGGCPESVNCEGTQANDAMNFQDSDGDYRNGSSKCGLSSCGSKFFAPRRVCTRGCKKGTNWAVNDEEEEEQEEKEPPATSEHDPGGEDRWSGRPATALRDMDAVFAKEDRERQEKAIQLLRGLMIARHMDVDHIPAEVDKGLFVGSVGAAKNLQELQKKGITHVLTVATNIQPAWPDAFKHTTVQVLDSPRVDLACHFGRCFDFIDDAIGSGGAILVHCFAGRSRSVTVVTAYLMRSQRLTMEQALKKVQRVRPEAGPNTGFLLQLRQLEEKLIAEGVVVNKQGAKVANSLTET